MSADLNQQVEMTFCCSNNELLTEAFFRAGILRFHVDVRTFWFEDHEIENYLMYIFVGCKFDIAHKRDICFLI